MQGVTGETGGGENQVVTLTIGITKGSQRGGKGPSLIAFAHEVRLRD